MQIPLLAAVARSELIISSAKLTVPYSGHHIDVIDLRP